MAKKKKISGRAKASLITSAKTHIQAFTEVVGIIRKARQKAFHVVNTTLIDLYWQVGEYLSLRVNDAGWGRAVVRQLADHIRKTDPDSKGFSVQNLWRMKQFYETYREREKLSPVVREIHPDAENIFKDVYLVNFLDIPESHTESDLQKSENIHADIPVRECQYFERDNSQKKV